MNEIKIDPDEKLEAILVERNLSSPGCWALRNTSVMSASISFFMMKRYTKQQVLAAKKDFFNPLKEDKK